MVYDIIWMLSLLRGVEGAVSLSDWLGWLEAVHPLWLGLALVPELLLHDRLDNDSCDRA